MNGIEGKIAIITGGGRGIGRQTALRLAEEGALGIVLNDLDEAPLKEVVDKVEAFGTKTVAVAGSVVDSNLATRLVKEATDNFGGIDHLVTCAGFPWAGMVHRITDKQWQTIIDVHLTGTFWIVRESMRIMRESAREELDQGKTAVYRKIVTISSGAANGAFGNANYAAAKAGILGLTRTVAAEGAQFNILANSVSFGMVDTRLTQAEDSGDTIDGRVVAAFPRGMRQELVQRIPLQRPATVEEAAGSIVFLLSQDADFITGQTLVVNGGRG